MPYARNSELPKGVRDALPSEAQTVYRTVYNENEDKGESGAAAIAWTAVKNGWKKDEDGAWVRKEARWTSAANICKVDEDQQLVFGWLSVAVDKNGTPIVDSQGDIIPGDELEKAAYNYVLVSRKAGEMHQKTQGVGRLVESMVFTKAKQEALGIPAGVLPETAWWVGYKIDDEEVWKRVKSGEYQAFSIGGSAVREPVEGGET